MKNNILRVEYFGFMGILFMYFLHRISLRSSLKEGKHYNFCLLFISFYKVRSEFKIEY